MSSQGGQDSQEKFIVQLQTPTGQVLPSIQWDGHRCFVGEPGQEFVVTVTRSLRYPHKVYRASLQVDGKRVGYRYYIEDDWEPLVFKGWLESGTSGGVSYRHFKLASCQPSSAAATVASADQLAEGRVQLHLQEVVVTDKKKPSSNRKRSALPCSQADQRLPEGKKWFMAPGLKAEAGSHATGTGWAKREFQEVASLPSVHVRYDSSEALYLRKALDPSLPPHRAILRKSANPAIAALGAEPADASSGAGAAAAAAGGGHVKHEDAGVKHEAAGVKPEAAGVKHEVAGMKHEAAGVKRELGAGDDEYVPRSATAANRIDLTEEPVQPICVNGRQLARDELAVCDLCDSDEDDAAAPKWQVHKKQHISVDV